MVEGGNVLHRIKRENKLTGRGNVRGHVREDYVQGNVRISDVHMLLPY